MQPHISPLDLSGRRTLIRRRRRQRISVVASTRVAKQSSRRQPDELQRAHVKTPSATTTSNAFIGSSRLIPPPCIARFRRVVMSLQLPAGACDASAPPPHSPPPNTRVLASVLSDIGASEFLPSFIEAEQDDSCINSFRVAKAVEKTYGLPLELAAKFVEKCRAVAARGAEAAGDKSPSNSLLTPSVGPFLFRFFFVLFAALCFL
jgi:hypothetical protein